MLKFKSVFSVGVAVLLASAAMPAFSETLEESVQASLSNHPQVEGAMAALKSTRESRREAVSGYFPDLSVSAAGGRLYGDNSTSRGLSVTRGTGYSYLWEGSLTARQMIFDGMETSNRVDSANASSKAAELNISDIRETLAFQTIQTYIDLLRVRKGLTMLRGQQQSVKDYLSQIRGMVDQGAADEAELQQAIDVSVILDNYIADYEGQEKTFESNYFELTGKMPEGDFEMTSVSVGEIPATPEEAIAIAKKNHPLLRSAMYESEAAKHDIDAERASIIPKLDGELSYLKRDQEDIIGGEAIDARALLRMNWNFETGGAQLARIKQRTYEHHQTQARIKEIERGIEGSIHAAYAELRTADRQLGNQKKRYDLNAKLYETYQVQFEGALISVLQLMQSDNQVLITDLDRLNAEMRVMLARYNILASMGQLQKALNVEIASSHPSRMPEK